MSVRSPFLPHTSSFELRRPVCLLALFRKLKVLVLAKELILVKNLRDSSPVALGKYWDAVCQKRLVVNDRSLCH